MSGESQDRLSSEQRYDIKPQPPETCQKIDESIKAVEQALSCLKGASKMDEAELKEAAENAEYLLAEIVGYRKSGLLEDIRQANIAIREWGEQWKQCALENATEPNDK